MHKEAQKSRARLAAVCVYSHIHPRKINPVWSMAMELGLTLQSVIHTRRPLLAVTYQYVQTAEGSGPFVRF